MLGWIRNLVSAAASGLATATHPGTTPATPSSNYALTPTGALNWIGAHPIPTGSVIDSVDAAKLLLRQLGITPFTSTIGACTDLTFPLAVGGAVHGPYTPGIGDLTIQFPPHVGPRVDLNAVRKGEVLYGFVPTGIIDESTNKSGMRVAWLNLDTLQGDIGEPMGGFTDTILDAVKKRAAEARIPRDVINGIIDSMLKPALNRIPQAGVRGGLVDTGPGTVLSAIYGTVQRSNATCLFAPSLGITAAR
ncbi:hypothetical protein [Gordonia rhizosphera]|uniref:Uncharacterized protein n=1 Tax=Gordonia rhizosphera NBRC 16068 TaxID=1108045 RepID=K6WCB8_9ACTN|nr:hypothetical protein [Gordonia rhizosphera]GAB91366.1 hypothetical protein GORHZ_129_00090 [Gordonia rhizosphera NBRC 16068]